MAVAAVGIIAILAVSAATLVRVYGGLTSDGAAPKDAAYSQQGLSFRYPAGWKVNELDLALHYEAVLGYLGSNGASGTMTCGADYIPGAGGTCAQHLTLGPDSVVVKVSQWDGPPTPDGMVAWTLSGDPAATAVTVGGQAAARASAEPDVADTATQWIVSTPGDKYLTYVITAYLKGPDLVAEQAQVQALVDSISIQP